MGYSLRLAPIARLLAAGVLAAGCVCLSPAVQGGEKVRFSDGNRIPVKPDSLTKRGLENPFGSSLDRDSSLGGVPAAPFSPAAAPSRTLTPKEKDLIDQRENWMQRSMDDLSISEKTANEAFGVRDYKAEKTDSRPKSDMQKYFDKADEKVKLSESESLETSHAKESALKTLGDPKEMSSTERTDPLAAPGMARDPSALGASGGIGLSGAPGSLFEPGHMSMRNSFGEPDLAAGPRFNNRASDLLQERKARIAGFREVMNVGSSGAAKGDLLQGSMDPVNFHPDLTRDVMDPVTPLNLSGVLSGAKVTFSDSLRPVGLGAGLPRSGALDDLLIKGQGSVSVAPSFVPINQPRHLAPSPLVLEMPKRNF